MIDEQTLILYFYGDELDDAQRRRVERALAADPALAARYATLAARLRRARDIAPPPMAEDFTARLHAHLDAAAPSGRAHARWPWVLAAGLALAIGLGTVVALRDGAPPTAPAVQQAAAVPAPRPAFERALTAHFRDSRLTLAGLDETPPAGRDDAIADILSQNRAQIRAAEARGDKPLARVLRAFEPVLLALASHEVGTDDADALREQLAFELDAMLTKYGRDASDGSKSF